MIDFGSVCSGIEAASVAFAPLGWRAAWFSEIERFPCAALAHHYPRTPNHGDMTTLVRRILRGEVSAPAMLCGGTPCQAFSVAGKRESLDDARGNLTLTFCEIANAIDHVRASRGEQPCIVKWENVPGVLSTRDNAFGCFLGALAGSGCELFPAGWEPGQPLRWPDAGCVYGPQRAIAWRVLDAQYFGLAQRRRRVFVVASARNGFDPAAVLLESDGERRDSAPRREAREVAPTIPARSLGGGGLGTDFDCDGGLIPAIAGCLNSVGGHAVPGNSVQDADQGYLLPVPPPISLCLNAGAMGRLDAESETLIPTFGGGFDVAHTLKAEGFDASEDGTGRGTPLVPVAFMADDYKPGSFEACDAARPLTTSADRTRAAPIAMANMAVRRLTPRECERLQGFPDDYTLIPWRGKSAEQCPDGPRYKALGNSWAVPCVRWIGERIQRELARSA